MQPPPNDNPQPDAGAPAGSAADQRADADACGIAAMMSQGKPARPPAPSRAAPVEGTAGLIEQVDRQIARSRRHKQPFALLCLVADQIAGTDGRDDADQARRALADCASRLCSRVRATDQVLRYGPRHFGVLLPDANEAAAWAVSLRLLGAGAGIYRVGDALLELRLCAGHAVYPDAGTDGAALVHAAHVTTTAPAQQAERRRRPPPEDAQPAQPAREGRHGGVATEPAAYPEQPLDWGPWWR